MQDQQILKNTYKVIKKIGAGSYGEVFLVENLINQQQQVIKKSSIDKISNFKEAEYLLSFDHPNIVKAYDVFVEHNEVCIVMKFYENGTVLSQIQHKQNLDKMYIKWAAQLISAINYIHSKNMLHRDIKLENLFLDENFNLVVGDFGVSKDLNASLAKTFIGTPQHMSPEIFDNLPYSFASDVWAIGCALYHMVEKRFPFTGGLPKIMQAVEKVEYQQMKYITDLRIVDLVHRMIMHNPESRITTHQAGQLLNEIFTEYSIPLTIDLEQEKPKESFKETVVTTNENQIIQQLKQLKESEKNNPIVQKLLSTLIKQVSNEDIAYNMILSYLFVMKQVELKEICNLVQVDVNKLVLPKLDWNYDPYGTYLSVQTFFETLFFEMTNHQNVEFLLKIVRQLVVINTIN
ncbi:Kinase, NEK [Spironucleus salmonicida]|uniref:non-specific serine/threonine protein kinase n=1 Tax=Spironucleus salmonicida TaxID=348837 RepID=V6LL85_9EUKA|nr:Kinase, NEK [Spironucleus salmonicida]|eukprot:EST45312.1 Kinase, NEK [Spironucleus salmonicida]